jgi:hypothetical protein
MVDIAIEVIGIEVPTDEHGARLRTVAKKLPGDPLDATPTMSGGEHDRSHRTTPA